MYVPVRVPQPEKRWVGAPAESNKSFGRCRLQLRCPPPTSGMEPVYAADTFDHRKPSRDHE